MAGNPADLAAALAALAAAINNLPGGGGAPPAGGAAAAPPVLDPYTSAEPFDLSSRAGSTAFANASSALDETWDGTVANFPSFLIALRIRANEVRWDVAGDTGIITIAGTNLLTHYHSTTDAAIANAYAARTNDRAIQNSKAMYKCIKASISGDLKAVIFDQIGNIPTIEDGPTLFKTLTTFTMAASLQLSMLAVNNITAFDPADHKFNVPVINTKLSHLFVLAATHDQELSDQVKLQHLLTTYAKIKQPEQWAQWVCVQVDNFDSGNLANPQAFMNDASVKYAKISASSGAGFQGSATSLQEDIVAMLASAKKRKTAPSSSSASDGGSSSAGDSKSYLPFVKHFKKSAAADAEPYHIGDTKTWNGETWHCCDCPTHRNHLKWHPHPPESCRTRQRWLANRDSTSAAPRAHPAVAPSPGVPPVLDGAHSVAPSALTEPTGATSSDSAATPPSAAPSDVTSLLASALNLTGDNALARDAIADAINALALE